MVEGGGVGSTTWLIGRPSRGRGRLAAAASGACGGNDDAGGVGWAGGVTRAPAGPPSSALAPDCPGGDVTDVRATDTADLLVTVESWELPRRDGGLNLNKRQ